MRPRNPNLRLTPVLVAASLALLPSAVSAGEVTLRVKGGGLEVSGELRSFDGTTYVIEAPSVGTMSFDATRFECLGENCTRRINVATLPAERLTPDSPDRVIVRGSGPAGRQLLPSLIRGYAASLGASTSQIIGTGRNETQFRIADAGGAELATIVLRSEAASGADLQSIGAAIGTADRLPDEITSEAQKAAPAGSDKPSPYAVALDGLAVIVSQDNPATSISEENLARILSGQFAQWSDAGIPAGRVAIYTTGQRSSAESVAAEVLLQPRGLAAAAATRELDSEADVADAVARDPNGIGIVSFASQRNARRLNLEGSCGLITRPTSFAVKAGEYALSRKLYLYTGGLLSQPAARGLLRYALSRDAQQTISDEEFVDERVEVLPFEEQTERMAYALNVPAQGFDMTEMKRLLSDLRGAKRLSLTFRFNSGSFDLSAESKLDVMRLAELMQRPEFTGKTVMLVGFTDADGKYGPNAAISTRRANQLRAAVLAASDGKIPATAIITKGFGPLAPIACNDTQQRRQLNRRVEVWIKDK